MVAKMLPDLPWGGSALPAPVLHGLNGHPEKESRSPVRGDDAGKVLTGHGRILPGEPMRQRGNACSVMQSTMALPDRGHEIPEGGRHSAGAGAGTGPLHPTSGKKVMSWRCSDAVERLVIVVARPCGSIVDRGRRPTSLSTTWSGRCVTGHFFRSTASQCRGSAWPVCIPVSSLTTSPCTTPPGATVPSWMERYSTMRQRREGRPLCRSPTPISVSGRSSYTGSGLHSG